MDEDKTVEIPPAMPVLTGDEAVAIISALHLRGLEKGYQRVRQDRGQHPALGEWYELGFSTGEVAARFSHQGNVLFRHPDVDEARRIFDAALLSNARLARKAASPRRKQEGHL